MLRRGDNSLTADAPARPRTLGVGAGARGVAERSTRSRHTPDASLNGCLLKAY
jgi:hypothetical protein